MNYKDAFQKMGKALDAIDPKTIGQAPQSLDIQSETLTVGEKTLTGTVAGIVSEKILDYKDHFPIITQTQAQSSMARVLQLTEAPVWYAGSLTELRQMVYGGIMTLHPSIVLNVKVPVDQAVALSDGQSPAKTSKKSVKDPNDVAEKEVPSVSRPTLTSAQVEEALNDEETRQVVAGRLMEVIEKQIETFELAKKTAQKLLKNGLKAEEFDQLSTFLQEDILRDLVSRKVSTQASVENRRLELLERLK